MKNLFLAALLISFNTFAEVVKTDCKAMNGEARNSGKVVKSVVKEEEQKKTKIQ